MKGEKVRKCTPGDLVEVNGILVTKKPDKNVNRNDPLIQETII